MCLACWPCRSGGQLREAPGHQWYLIPTLWEKKSGNKIRTKVYKVYKGLSSHRESQITNIRMGFHKEVQV